MAWDLVVLKVLAVLVLVISFAGFLAATVYSLPKCLKDTRDFPARRVEGVFARWQLAQAVLVTLGLAGFILAGLGMVFIPLAQAELRTAVIRPPLLLAAIALSIQALLIAISRELIWRRTTVASPGERSEGSPGERRGASGGFTSGRIEEALEAGIAAGEGLGQASTSGDAGCVLDDLSGGYPSAAIQVEASDADDSDYEED